MGFAERAMPLAMATICGVIGGWSCAPTELSCLSNTVTGYYTFQPMLASEVSQAKPGSEYPPGYEYQRSAVSMFLN